MSKRKLIAVALLAIVPATAGAFLLQGREPADGARLFAQVLQRIEDSAVDSLSRNALYEKAARGLIKNLRDPYADLYSPEELASLAPPAHNAADTRFVQRMIPHHAQALEMTALVAGRAASPELPLLAERITISQRDEIAQMERWLRDRGEQVPTAHASHPGHSTLIPGMLDDKDLEALGRARGAEFDRLFLSSMIQHHRGAVAMVTQLYGTPGAAQDDTVFKFADDVGVDQTTEIARMERMLDALPAGEPAS